MSRNKKVMEINEEIVFREEDDGAFLFDPDTGRLCYLNELGTFIWRHFDRHLTMEEIIELVTAEYPETPGNQVTRDCRQFIDDLKTFGFITNE